MFLAVLLAGPSMAQDIGFEPNGVNTGTDGRVLSNQFLGNGSFDQVPFGAESIYDTSEYALGSYIHNIIFIQDDQLRNLDTQSHPKVSTEECDTINCGVVHWTDAMLANRKERVEEAASFWNEESLDRHHPSAQLDINIHFTNDVYNNGAPFTVNDIGDGGSSVGFVNALAEIDSDYGNNTSFITATRQFNDDIRRSHQSHWAVTTFVKPYYGTASASINGPYTKGYEDDPTWTYAHELGHVFGARDEYGSHETDERSGYLYAYNTNAAYLPGGEDPNPNSVSAVMKTHGNYFISDGTNNAIGWLDSDEDTIPDILDTFPAITTDTSDSSSSSGQFEAQIDVTVSPLPSPDPFEDDFTINTLTSAYYRVDRELWTHLNPVDGVFGDYVEQFEIERLFTSPGTHRIDFRVANSVGNHTDHQFIFIMVPEPSTIVYAAIIFLGANVRRRTLLRG